MVLGQVTLLLPGPQFPNLLNKPVESDVLKERNRGLGVRRHWIWSPASVFNVAASHMSSLRLSFLIWK